jgi:hypothetical protein
MSVLFEVVTPLEPHPKRMAFMMRLARRLGVEIIDRTTFNAMLDYARRLSEDRQLAKQEARELEAQVRFWKDWAVVLGADEDGFENVRRVWAQGPFEP